MNWEKNFLTKDILFLFKILPGSLAGAVVKTAVPQMVHQFFPGGLSVKMVPLAFFGVNSFTCKYGIIVSGE